MCDTYRKKRKYSNGSIGAFRGPPVDTEELAALSAQRHNGKVTSSNQQLTTDVFFLLMLQGIFEGVMTVGNVFVIYLVASITSTDRVWHLLSLEIYACADFGRASCTYSPVAVQILLPF